MHAPPIAFSRVKKRSSDLLLLIKPNEPISGIRLSSGISHSRKRIYRSDTSARFGFSSVIRQSSRSLPDGVFAYSFQRHTFLVSCYPIVLIVPLTSSLSRSESLRWNRFSFNTVAPCTLRHRFCISSDCPSLLLWIHPPPLNASL